MKIYKSNYDAAALVPYRIEVSLKSKMDSTLLFLDFLLARNMDVDAWKNRLYFVYAGKNFVLPITGPIFTLVEKHPLYQRDARLALATTACILGLLNYKECPADLVEKNLLVSTVLRPHLHFDYYQAKCLEALMDKEQAMALWREFVDSRTLSQPDGDPDSEPSSILSVNSKWPEVYKGSFEMTEYVRSDGRAGVKIERCKWNESLRECDDTEYAYSIACHYDFEAFRKANPNFRLTRNQTLTVGASYCDFCVHDVRKHDPREHPDKQFFEKI